MAQLSDMQEAMAELLAAYEETLLRLQDGGMAHVALPVYVPATERRRLLLIGQLKQLLMAHAPAQHILQQVK